MSLFNFVDFVGPAVNALYLNALDLIRNAMSANSAGQVTLATTQDNFGRGIRVIRKKAVTTSRSSVVVLANDPELVYNIPSAGLYYIESMLFPFGTTTGTQGMHLNINYSGTFTNTTIMLGSGFLNSSLSNTAVPIAPNPTTAEFVFGTMSTTQGTDIFYINSVLNATSTGTFGVSWAQGSSSANASNMGAGSFISVTQLS